MKRIITLTVLNQTGVLNRITGLFTKRHYNIESITVGHTETEGISRITFVVHVENEKETEQLTKQLNKQIDVLKVTDITNQSIVQRELALIRVVSPPSSRAEINGVIEPFRAAVVDVAKDSVVVQVTGESNKIEALIELLKPYGIKEVARTGTTAFARGTQQKPASIKTISIL
ncbi:acetolactate synthase small subunit [Bacillus sonorensis]|uniref:Acetolactate synthase small subunit n=2 Tax=Bacillus sonorensis TaxID=119858 RepID=M5P6X4_9BACI|nr:MULTISPECIES: acetolactate synthase small subunit [Bacillus]TWK78941.1 Acetolactate synthase small subunit [Bacillus paralicheniformis]ASB88038.1 Acetolactate synthase [Bacillus sonorensis]EME75198.1 acetolactate synthase 3 regulatory subunit [Bacillus sonorensis L12]MBG9915917.1 acetolactate synthase [Bacillus sonorensis]MCZ0071436.1 acetolactate synthase small subunit [Bacillus sonorensis]